MHDECYRPITPMWQPERTMTMGKIVSFINYKGGVGKTTTTYHVGCCLAETYGKKVLMVDIDPQTNLSFLCAPVERWEKQKQNIGTIANMYSRFQQRIRLETKKFIWQTPIKVGRKHIDNLDLIPCDVDLLGEDLGGGGLTGTFQEMKQLRQEAKEFLRERSFLRNTLAEVADKYDYILIDCPPNLYLMTQNALVASKWYIITAIPDHLSTIGLSILQNKVRKIGERMTSARRYAGESSVSAGAAQLGGVVFVKVRIGGSRITNTHSTMMETVKRQIGSDLCFQCHTTELIGYGEAAEHALPVWHHDSPNAKHAAGKKEYNQITDEFVKRF
jgi:chromosome partitioning protein